MVAMGRGGEEQEVGSATEVVGLREIATRETQHLIESLAPAFLSAHLSLPLTPSPRVPPHRVAPYNSATFRAFFYYI